MLSVINICADVLRGRNMSEIHADIPLEMHVCTSRWIYAELASIQRGQMRIMDVEQLGKFCWFHRMDLFVQAGM